MTSVINSLSVCITLLGPRRPGAGGSQQGFRGGQQAFQGAGQAQQGQEEGQEQEAIVETIKGMLEQLGEYAAAASHVGLPTLTRMLVSVPGLGFGTAASRVGSCKHWHASKKCFC